MLTAFPTYSTRSFVHFSTTSFFVCVHRYIIINVMTNPKTASFKIVEGEGVEAEPILGALLSSPSECSCGPSAKDSTIAMDAVFSAFICAHVVARRCRLTV